PRATISGRGGPVTLRGGLTFGGLTVAVPGYTLTGASGGLGLAQDATIDAPSSGSTVIDVPISGSYGITTSGQVEMTASSSYTGDTVVSSGTLTLSVNDPDSAGMSSPSFQVAAGATLVANSLGRFNFGFGLPSVEVRLANGATLDVTGNALPSGPTINAPMTLVTTGATATLKSTSGTGLNLNARRLTLDTASGSTLTINSLIWNNSSVFKTGAGRAVVIYNFNASGTRPGYSGRTFIDEGTLQIGAGGTTGDLSSTSEVVIAAGANLIFNRSDALSYAVPISGDGNIIKNASGTTTLNAQNSFTGTTTINSGTLVMGVDGALSGGSSAVTISSGGTLNVNGKSIAVAKINGVGVLNLGSGGNVTLTSGTSNIASIIGTGTITVSSGAVLNLTAPLNNTGVSIRLDAGSLEFADGTYRLGTLSNINGPSSLDFSNTGNVNLTVSTLNLTSGAALTLNNWTQGSDRFFAAAISPTSPTRNLAGVSPLDNLQVQGNSTLSFYWASGSPGELLTAAPNYWDTTASNSTVDGGTGTWDGSNTNWATANGVVNGAWLSTRIAIFDGSAGTGTVSSGGGASTGLIFNGDGYTLTGSRGLLSTST
ncbi:autotransporter-associated beta strand repeat-containing protein, partial [Nostoc sp. NIES-2111]